MTVLVNRLAVMGVGLIGGSFALALKAAGAVEFVVGCGRNQDNLREALSLGIIDDATTDPVEAVQDADVVFLSVPVRAMAAIARDIAHALKPGAVVTDAGSTKEVVFGELFAWLPGHVQVVGGHPIAGSEKTGAGSAIATLYQGRRTILIEDKRTDPEAFDLVRQLWEAVGAKVETMGLSEHDVILGAVSHLPHLAAYALTETVLDWDDELSMLRFSAGGLRDFTRIASSSSEMWRDVCLDNGPVIVEAIDRYVKKLLELRGEVESQAGADLQQRFERCREIRRRMFEEDRK